MCNRANFGQDDDDGFDDGNGDIFDPESGTVFDKKKPAPKKSVGKIKKRRRKQDELREGE